MRATSDCAATAPSAPVAASAAISMRWVIVRPSANSISRAAGPYGRSANDPNRCMVSPGYGGGSGSGTVRSAEAGQTTQAARVGGARMR